MIIKCILIGLMGLSRLAFAQTYNVIDNVVLECIYDYSFEQDSLSKNFPATDKMILRIGHKISVFSHSTNLFTDSVFHADNGLGSIDILSKVVPVVQANAPHLLANYRIFKNYTQKGNLTFTTNHGRDEYYYVNDDEPMKWVIDSSTDSIMVGYLCKRATTRFRGRDYIAWFTTQIPISDGPYKFRGLPGLIVQIYDKRNEHRFQLVAIKKPKTAWPIIYTENRYIQVTPSNYVMAWEMFQRELYKRFQNEEGLVNFSREDKARVLNKLKSRNNYIERF